MEILGIDMGFGFTKATNGEDSVIFKSVIGEAIDVQSSDGMYDERGEMEHFHAEIDGVEYFLGEMAVRQSSERLFTLDQNRFVDQHVKILALAAAAKLVKSRQPVNLVTGLPIAFYASHKKQLINTLVGEHTVIIRDAEGNAEETIVNINKMCVLFQPWGSLFNLMLNDQGELCDKRPIREKFGIIDIGFRTSDYSVSDKMHYSERGSRTTDSGISHAFNLIANKLREKSGVNVELYRLYDAVHKGSIRVRGEEYDLRELTDHIFGKLAAKVANEIDNLWLDDWDIDAIIITGGGGHVLAEKLEPLIKGSLAPIDPDSDARFYNVLGYRKFGKHTWAKGE